ncbi:MAG TPA: 23S rRNA (uracil(1939)-C(5))-methyltransferase RlmD [Alphaproteobacteria bacterium]|nr:23S rRNA (uracil(1939)-C(5))-methyltransferase RlmD [Alphaproteobacteria bacterium]
MPRPPARHRPKSKPRPSAVPLELTVESVGARGDGLAHYAGQRVYIPLVLPGERVRVRLGQPRGDGLAAELLEVLEPSPDRNAPPCRHYGACGGCGLQHWADLGYAEWKTAQVRQALARAGLEDAPVEPVRRTPPASRRRATFVARRLGRKVHLGFNARGSHRIVEVEACHIVVPAIAAILAPLRDLLGRVLPDGEGADIHVAQLAHGLDMLLNGPPALDLAAREALAAFAHAQDLTRLSWQPPGGLPEPVAVRRRAEAVFSGVPVSLAPGAFLQASAAGEAALVEAVLAAVGPAARVADLFAGSGTFTFALARTAQRVLSVESEPGAHAAVATAARTHGLGDRIEARRRDLDSDPLSGDELKGFDAIVFDPPRAGARAQTAALAESRVPRLVAVSCNPATLARDLRILVEGGYRLEGVQPIDQFVWSPHIEVVARLTRSGDNLSR